MRERKYRGMQVNWKGERTGTMIYGSDLIQSFDQRYISNNGDGGQCPVDPDTVGEYTGLRDRNHKEIYEGDMIDRGDAVVCFRKGRFQPVYNFGKEEEMEDEFHLFAEDITVLGNIYEHL